MKNKRKVKYGLFKFNRCYVLTCHHPAILGNWIKNLAPDSVWPAIDYLREEGVLPQIDRATSTKEYEMLVKDKVNETVKKLLQNQNIKEIYESTADLKNYGLESEKK